MDTKKTRVRLAPSPTSLLRVGSARPALYNRLLADPEHLSAVAWGYFANRLPDRETAPDAIRAWFDRLLALFVPTVDHLDQLPVKAAFVFGFDPEAARANPENAAVLASDSTRSVLGEFGARARTHAGPVTPEDFNGWMNEIQAATGVKGEDLLPPVRIALTGSLSGPEFDRLLALIEDEAAPGLGIPSVQERVEQFVGG